MYNYRTPVEYRSIQGVEELLSFLESFKANHQDFFCDA